MVTSIGTRCSIDSALARLRTGDTVSIQAWWSTHEHKNSRVCPRSLVVQARTEAGTFPQGAGCQDPSLEPAMV